MQGSLARYLNVDLRLLYFVCKKSYELGSNTLLKQINMACSCKPMHRTLNEVFSGEQEKESIICVRMG